MILDTSCFLPWYAITLLTFFCNSGWNRRSELINVQGHVSREVAAMGGSMVPSQGLVCSSPGQVWSTSGSDSVLIDKAEFSYRAKRQSATENLLAFDRSSFA